MPVLSGILRSRLPDSEEAMTDPASAGPSGSLESRSASLKVGLRLFGLSFAALFLELMVIRWAPSEVRLVAYYANLMLVSSFLGLGVGAMSSSRGWNLFRFFAPVLALDVLLLLGLSSVTLPGSDGEMRFFQAEGHQVYSYLILVFIFVFNAITFVPLGEEIGKQFHRLKPLRAYSWDLGGSLAGTLCFGGFSLLYFSPVLGMALVILVALCLSSWKARIWGLPCYALALWSIVYVGDGGAYWSPYYFIAVGERQAELRPVADGRGQVTRLVEVPAGEPLPDVRTMTDPPIYVVHVNQDFYQMHGSVDTGRYSEGSWQKLYIASIQAQYLVPYQLVGKVDRVLVLGAGGGMDVQTALMQGARRVDAVEIDPVIPRISNRYSAAAPYANPDYQDRVVLHIDDARAFLQQNTEMFDLVVFGFLDSQALFSYGSSLRLDGYTYTVESFRKAFERVRPGGAMSVSFAAGREWMAQKLIQMLAQGTGRKPFVYVQGGRLVMVATKGDPTALPPELSGWKLSDRPETAVDLATDDWPYLYLERKSVPRDYAIVILLLLLVSIVTVTALRGSSLGASDSHFLFLGWGFLLLQTKSIGDCSLYFGTTWFVTTLVIAGVLMMVLLANWVALKFVDNFTPLLYLPLFCALALLLLVPREVILGQSYTLRLIWTLVAVPLPIFFAGLIFSTTFKNAANPSALFGSNLIGATIGGFCEYLGMWIGSEALSYIVVAAYAASLVSVLASRRSKVSFLPPGAARASFAHLDKKF